MSALERRRRHVVRLRVVLRETGAADDEHERVRGALDGQVLGVPLRIFGGKIEAAHVVVEAGELRHKVAGLASAHGPPLLVRAGIADDAALREAEDARVVFARGAEPWRERNARIARLGHGPAGARGRADAPAHLVVTRRCAHGADHLLRRAAGKAVDEAHAVREPFGRDRGGVVRRSIRHVCITVRAAEAKAEERRAPLVRAQFLPARGNKARDGALGLFVELHRKRRARDVDCRGFQAACGPNDNRKKVSGCHARIIPYHRPKRRLVPSEPSPHSKTS